MIACIQTLKKEVDTLKKTMKLQEKKFNIDKLKNQVISKEKKRRNKLFLFFLKTDLFSDNND